jgi:hypothetical protein
MDLLTLSRMEAILPRNTKTATKNLEIVGLITIGIRGGCSSDSDSPDGTAEKWQRPQRLPGIDPSGA